MFERSHRTLSLSIWLGVGVLASALSAAYGQYPGHIETAPQKANPLRAIAVLEWTGEPGKPSASRIIPISVFDGDTYQPGGLYLARPEPLAVESGTEYILQVAGIPKGRFDIHAAQDMQGYWFGYGTWKPLVAPAKPHKLQPSKITPKINGGDDDDKPHLKIRQNGSGDSEEGKQGSSSNTQSGNTQSGSSSSQAPESDPDRPTLQRRSDSPTPNSSSANSNGANSSSEDASPRETPIGGSDPDRPRLEHGDAHPTDPEFEAKQLSGAPVDLQQMIAVSDATDREPHPFAYSWADPGDAAKMQAQMENLAEKALSPPASPSKPAVKRRSTATTHAAHKTTAPSPNPLLKLDQERFAAYQLTYDGGATLVLSAQSTDSAGKIRYITLIGQPDFNGTVHSIFQSVTDDAHLDQMPKMQLVDAVDPRANGRGDLVFELRSDRDRQFAFYQVSAGTAEQVFTTGPLRLSAAPPSS